MEHECNRIAVRHRYGHIHVCKNIDRQKRDQPIIGRAERRTHDEFITDGDLVYYDIACFKPEVMNYDSLFSAQSFRIHEVSFVSCSFGKLPLSGLAGKMPPNHDLLRAGILGSLGMTRKVGNQIIFHTPKDNLIWLVYLVHPQDPVRQQMGQRVAQRKFAVATRLEHEGQHNKMRSEMEKIEASGFAAYWEKGETQSALNIFSTTDSTGLKEIQLRISEYLRTMPGDGETLEDFGRNPLSYECDAMADFSTRFGPVITKAKPMKK